MAHTPSSSGGVVAPTPEKILPPHSKRRHVRDMEQESVCTAHPRQPTDYDAACGVDEDLHESLKGVCSPRMPVRRKLNVADCGADDDRVFTSIRRMLIASLDALAKEFDLKKLIKEYESRSIEERISLDIMKMRAHSDVDFRDQKKKVDAIERQLRQMRVDSTYQKALRINYVIAILDSET